MDFDRVPAIFLDMDGTVVEPPEGKDFINHPDDVRLMSNVRDTLDIYEQDHLILGVTNQGGIAFEHFGLSTYFDIRDEIMRLVPQIDRIEFAPAYPRAKSDIFSADTLLRKPQYGMFAAHEAHYRERGVQINYAASVMVGDAGRGQARNEDEVASENAGVDFVHANTFFQRNE